MEMSQDSTSKPQKAYEYAALDTFDFSNPQIRLCRLLPGNFDELISCELDNIHLSRAWRQYTTLSYTWGAATENQQISVDGKTFIVRRNLFEALRAIRNPDRNLCLWVDSICIDQSSIAERNEQVKIMGDIYRGCASMILWLGLPSSNSNAALNFLDNLDKEEFRPEEVAWNIKDAVSQLYCRPYFTRAWIVQEVMQAKDIIIRCGDKEISWYPFIRMLSSQRIFEHRRVAEELISACAAHRSFAHSFAKHRPVAEPPNEMASLGSNQIVPLEELLCVFRGAQCTDVRDRIFSLLSLAKMPRKMRNLSNGLADLVDYEIEIPQLYLALLGWYPRPNFLTCAMVFQDALRLLHTDIMSAWENETAQDEHGIMDSLVKRMCRNFVQGVAQADSTFLATAENEPLLSDTRSSCSTLSKLETTCRGLLHRKKKLKTKSQPRAKRPVESRQFRNYQSICNAAPYERWEDIKLDYSQYHLHCAACLPRRLRNIYVQCDLPCRIDGTKIKLSFRRTLLGLVCNGICHHDGPCEPHEVVAPCEDMYSGHRCNYSKIYESLEADMTATAIVDIYERSRNGDCSFLKREVELASVISDPKSKHDSTLLTDTLGRVREKLPMCFVMCQEIVGTAFNFPNLGLHLRRDNFLGVDGATVSQRWGSV